MSSSNNSVKRQVALLRAQVFSAVNEANSSISPERQVTYKSALTVVKRSLDASRNKPFEVREFHAMRELSAFITLSQKNKSLSQIPRNTDLLPVGHPASTTNHAMTASAFVNAQIQWALADSRISDEARPLLASLYTSEPESPEYKYALIRLGALPPGSAPLEALVASFGDGNSFAARRARAMLQRRDRKGRFAYQGGGIKALIKRLSGVVENLTGKTVSSSSDGNTVRVELPDGRLVDVPVDSGEFIKAIINPTPDGFSGIPAQYSAGDKIADEASLQFFDAPHGFTKDDSYSGDGVMYTDDSYDIIKRSDGTFDVSQRGAKGLGTADSWSESMKLIQSDEPNLIKAEGNKAEQIARLTPQQIDDMYDPNKNPFDVTPGGEGSKNKESAQKQLDDLKNSEILRITKNDDGSFRYENDRGDSQFALELRATDDGKISVVRTEYTKEQDGYEESGESDLGNYDSIEAILEDDLFEEGGDLPQEYDDWKAQQAPEPVAEIPSAPAGVDATKALNDLAEAGIGFDLQEDGSLTYDLGEVSPNVTAERSVEVVDGKFKVSETEYTYDESSNSYDVTKESDRGTYDTIDEVLDDWGTSEDVGQQYDDWKAQQAPEAAPEPVAELPATPQPSKKVEEFTKFEVPEGAIKLPLDPAGYDPEGRVDEASTDFTDDPAVLANKYDTDDLVDTLEAAIVPQDGAKNATGYGPLEFNQGEEFVPAEAIYSALDQQGEDAQMIAAKIYDDFNGDTKNQDALTASREAQAPEAELPQEEVVEEEVFGSIGEILKAFINDVINIWNGKYKSGPSRSRIRDFAEQTGIPEADIIKAVEDAGVEIAPNPESVVSTDPTPEPDVVPVRLRDDMFIMDTTTEPTNEPDVADIVDEVKGGIPTSSEIQAMLEGEGIGSQDDISGDAPSEVLPKALQEEKAVDVSAVTTAPGQLQEIPYETSKFVPNDPADPDGPGKVEKSAGKAQVIDIAGRKVVIVDINGTPVPFYLSTGAGGKEDVPAGKWYPFFGVGEDGWINKGNAEDINNYYGSPELRAQAELLDATIGDIRANDSIPKVTPAGPHIDAINADLTPTENNKPDSVDNLQSNVDALVEKVKTTEVSTPAEATPEAVTSDIRFLDPEGDLQYQIAKAIEDEKQVRFFYSGEERIVIPIEVKYNEKNNNYNLVTLDAEGNIKNFTLSKIESAPDKTATPEAVTPEVISIDQIVSDVLEGKTTDVPSVDELIKTATPTPESNDSRDSSGGGGVVPEVPTPTPSNGGGPEQAPVPEPNQVNNNVAANKRWQARFGRKPPVFYKKNRGMFYDINQVPVNVGDKVTHNNPDFAAKYGEGVVVARIPNLQRKRVIGGRWVPVDYASYVYVDFGDGKPPRKFAARMLVNSDQNAVENPANQVKPIPDAEMGVPDVYIDDWKKFGKALGEFGVAPGKNLFGNDGFQAEAGNAQQVVINKDGNGNYAVYLKEENVRGYNRKVEPLFVSSNLPEAANFFVAEVHNRRYGVNLPPNPVWEGLETPADSKTGVVDVSDVPAVDAAGKPSVVNIDPAEDVQQQLQDAIDNGQKVAFLYNDKERLLDPINIWYNPKRDHFNLYAADPEGIKKNYTLDLVQKLDKPAEASPIPEAPVVEEDNSGFDSSVVNALKKAAQDFQNNYENVKSDYQLRATFDTAYLEDMQTGNRVKLSWDENSQGWKVQYDLLDESSKDPKYFADLQEAINEAQSDLRDLRGPANDSPGIEPKNEVPEAPATPSVDTVQIDPAGNAEQQIMDAIESGKKIAFNYNGKERVLTPLSVRKNPNNGNVNVYAEDADGERKNYTISKMEKVEKPAEQAPAAQNLEQAATDLINNLRANYDGVYTFGRSPDNKNVLIYGEMNRRVSIEWDESKNGYVLQDTDDPFAEKNVYPDINDAARVALINLSGGKAPSTTPAAEVPSTPSEDIVIPEAPTPNNISLKEAKARAAVVAQKIDEKPVSENLTHLSEVQIGRLKAYIKDGLIKPGRDQRRDKGFNEALDYSIKYAMNLGFFEEAQQLLAIRARQDGLGLRPMDAEFAKNIENLRDSYPNFASVLQNARREIKYNPNDAQDLQQAYMDIAVYSDPYNRKYRIAVESALESIDNLVSRDDLSQETKLSLSEMRDFISQSFGDLPPVPKAKKFKADDGQLEGPAAELAGYTYNQLAQGVGDWKYMTTVGGGNLNGGLLMLVNKKTGQQVIVKRDGDRAHEYDGKFRGLGIGAEEMVAQLYRDLGFAVPEFKVLNPDEKNEELRTLGVMEFVDNGFFNLVDFKVAGKQRKFGYLDNVDPQYRAELLDFLVANGIIGNTDRHGGNIMVGVDPITGKQRIVPIDNGLALFNGRFGVAEKQSQDPVYLRPDKVIAGNYGNYNAAVGVAAQYAQSIGRDAAKDQIKEFAERMRVRAEALQFIDDRAGDYMSARAQWILDNLDKYLDSIMSTGNVSF